MLLEAIKDPELEGLRGHVAAKLVDEGALIELVDGGDNFLFSLASSDLKQGAVQFLRRLAPLLAKVPNKIEIHGHTDARRFGSRAALDNWDLSFERANQARAVLEANGLAKGRIGAVLAHAENALYNETDPYAAENRRLAILVVRKGFEAERQGRAGAPGAWSQPGKPGPVGGSRGAHEAPAEAPHGSKAAEPAAPKADAVAPPATPAPAAAPPRPATASPKATVPASAASKPFKKSSAKRSPKKAGSKP
jgi:outer membrane protein OmpA-like peptidoglycan-associated protein